VAAAQFETMLRLAQERQAVGKSVLDIGCGRGEFMTTARDQGWRTAGLEIDPVSAHASQSRDLDVRVGSIFDTELPPGPWTVITLWDVLDHLEDPLGALRLAITELAPGGILIARGRNAALHARLKVSYSTLRPLAGALGVRDLSVVHRWGIRPQGWARLLRAAGLENVTLRPAALTPGDRYGSLGPPRIGELTKLAAAASLAGIYNLSLKKVYPFTSVLVCGSR
jgi:SAM-dependent methyltransferase